MKSILGSLLIALVLILGCSSKTSSTTSSSDGVTDAGPPELTYCTGASTFTSPITITGTAQYTRRNFYLAANGLGSASTTHPTYPATNHPIRRAEVRVLNSSGTQVQCTETDASGAFSFTLPADGGTYTIAVSSRSYNNYLKASVLNKTAENKFYTLTTTVVADGSKSVGTFAAAANGDVLGGAFNILDQFYEANEYLRTQVGTCTFTGCQNFTSARKVVAYWMKGFNPNNYFGSNDGLSFYLPSYYRLFLLGGISGNTDNSDTDHFDNSVILHEYGHFLEDAEFFSDSPGGSHDGNSVIDPRLAWSEGWGDFIQGAIRNENHYIDTLGNIDGTATIAFYVNLENFSGANSTDTPGSDGEGNYREFSVTRILWDAIDAVGDTQHAALDTTSSKFPELWASLTNTSNSLKDSRAAFRSVGLFHQLQDRLFTSYGGADWTNLRTIEWQKRAFTSSTAYTTYGQYITTSAGCSLSLTPNAAISSSNMYYNNHFYHLKITTAGTYSFAMNYSMQDAGALADLDIYLYNESARFGVSADMVKYARLSPNTSATPNTETFSVSLAAGHYLININAYTAYTVSGHNRQVNYTLTLNGSQLCPATSGWLDP